jgi:hypothetical protein
VIKIDSEKFKQAISQAEQEGSLSGAIGTLGEKTIHKTLKYYFANGIDHEAKIGGYYADIAGESGIIEIQTANFGRLRQKLEKFLPASRVTIVYPFEKKVNHFNFCHDTGKPVKTRTVNHKDLTRLFLELYRIKSFLNNANLSVCIVGLEVNKFKAFSKGQSRANKIKTTKYPVDILSEAYFKKPEDYKIFLPDNLPLEFTRVEFSKCCGYSNSALPIIILEHLGLIKNIGKRGRAFLYAID